MNNRQKILSALDWMLEDAECYVGCIPTTDPHEAARRIVEYFDEVKTKNPQLYDELMKKALEYRREQ